MIRRVSAGSGLGLLGGVGHGMACGRSILASTGDSIAGGGQQTDRDKTCGSSRFATNILAHNMFAFYWSASQCWRIFD
jgi:hypothetical protein